MNPLLVAAITVALPSPLHALSPSPPLGGVVATNTEGGILHRVNATTRVAVRVDRAGRPFAVSAVHRLVVLDKGDYVYVIPAPVVDVRAAPGSESVPGQRRGTILWSGFNAKRKVLAADAELAVAAAARSLPLRVVPRGSTVTLVNATPVRAGTFRADAVVPPLARYLDAVRFATRRGLPVPFGTARVTTKVRPGSVSVEAPLHVRGTVGGRRVDVVLGDGRPLRAAFPRGDGRVDLTVEPLPPVRLLTPPRGRSWRGAGVDGRALLDRANGVLLRLARVRQYDSFLANPDPRGAVATAFRYRTGVRAAATAPPPAAADRSGSRSWLATALVGAGVVAAAALGLAVWARS